MSQSAHDTYLESRVLSASPIELVRMLCHAAMGAVRDARTHLAAGDIAARSRSITWASNILVELAGSLDHQRGAEISGNLTQLYDYMIRRLTDANFQQNDAPLVEVLGLLATLSEGWNGVPTEGRAVSATAYENAWSQTVRPEPVAAYVSQSWSL